METGNLGSINWVFCWNSNTPSFPTAHFTCRTSCFLLHEKVCALNSFKITWTCVTCKKIIFSENSVCCSWVPGGGYWLSENSVRLFTPWVRTEDSRGALNKDKQMCDGVNVWKEKSEVGKRIWFPDKIISSPEGTSGSAIYVPDRSKTWGYNVTQQVLLSVQDRGRTMSGVGQSRPFSDE